MQAVRDDWQTRGGHVPVLIQGETAREGHHRTHDHANFAVADRPWVEGNCPAIPGTLLEVNSLVMKRRLSREPTAPNRAGLNGPPGNSVSDEISELDLGLQSKLFSCYRMASFAA